MKNILLFIAATLSVCSYSQTTNISGVINSYAQVTAVNCQSVNVSTTTGFSIGDRILLIQMQGAIIDTTNTPSFGTILNYNGAGNYEMGTIQNISGNTIILVDSTLRKYTFSGPIQIVKVPQYLNANVTAPLTAQAWNGTTGGILAMEVSGILTLSADIDMSGKGFRGATLTNGSLTNCLGDTSHYYLPAGSVSTAHKGEGIVTYYTPRADGKGSNANGGGGGHDCNGGGAGGGNYGMGGHGGDSKCNVSCPPYFYQNSGGLPARKVVYSNFVAKIFPGGGGGAGHQNNGGGTAGMAGGGIILIKADSISGNNHYIKSDGLNNTLIANIDGQGGGGAGGTILFVARAYSSLNVSVTGGYGGVDNFTGTDCHGKGGGGGGGVVWTSAPVTSGMTTYLTGGLPGMFTSTGSYCYNGSNGATAGQNGAALIDLMIPESTAPCALGVSSYRTEKLQIKPNPAYNTIEINFPTNFLNHEYVITDALGRKVLNGKITQLLITISISELLPATYFIRIDNSPSSSARFVKL